MARYTLLLATASAAVLLSGAAFAADLPAPAPVAAPAEVVPSTMDGFVFLGAGAAQVQGFYNGETEGDPANGLTVTGGASVAYQSASMLGFQGDVVLSRLQQTQYNNTGVDLQGDVAGHVFYRQPGSFLIGAIGQFGADNETNPFEDFSFQRAYGGAEAQVYAGNVTLYGQVAAERVTGSDYVDTGYVATAEARYFLTPNFKIEGHVGIDHLDYGAPDEGESQYKAGLGAEYRLDAMPLSVFAQYDFTHYAEENSSFTENDNRILVGVKWNFGTDTLEDRDHTGASLKPFSFDPMNLIPTP